MFWVFSPGEDIAIVPARHEGVIPDLFRAPARQLEDGHPNPVLFRVEPLMSVLSQYIQDQFPLFRVREELLGKSRQQFTVINHFFPLEKMRRDDGATQRRSERSRM